MKCPHCNCHFVAPGESIDPITVMTEDDHTPTKIPVEEETEECDTCEYARDRKGWSCPKHGKPKEPEAKGERDHYTQSIAISLKRAELKQNVDLQKWACIKGFKNFHCSSWIALQDEEDKIRRELQELEA